MGRSLTYPHGKSTTVNRYDTRGIYRIHRPNERAKLMREATYDVGAIHSIINTTSVLHVSFSPDPADPFPAILPMIGVMGSYDYPSAGIDEPMDCYLHGYVSSRIMRLAKASPEGLPVCVAATKVDGLVLALTPNSHSYNYRSAILHGYAKVVESVEEKVWAMELVTNSVVPDRWSNSRIPPDGAEMQSTNILRVRVVSASGKVRDGGPHDEAKDTKREEVTSKTWVGVVPVMETFGQPVPSVDNKVEKVPAYITSYVTETNTQNDKYANSAARLP